MTAAIPGLQDVQKAPDRPSEPAVIYTNPQLLTPSGGAGNTISTPTMPAPPPPSPSSGYRVVGEGGSANLPTTYNPNISMEQNVAQGNITNAQYTQVTGQQPSREVIASQQYQAGTITGKEYMNITGKIPERDIDTGQIYGYGGAPTRAEVVTSQAKAEEARAAYQAKAASGQIVEGYDVSALTKEQQAYVREATARGLTVPEAMMSENAPMERRITLQTLGGKYETTYYGTAEQAKKYAAEEQARYNEKFLAGKQMQSRAVKVGGREIGTEGYIEGGEYNIVKFINPTDEDYFRENYVRPGTTQPATLPQMTKGEIPELTLPQVPIKSAFGIDVRKDIMMTGTTSDIYKSAETVRERTATEAQALEKAQQFGKEYVERVEYVFPIFKGWRETLEPYKQAMYKLTESGPAGEVVGTVGGAIVTLADIPILVFEQGPSALISFGGAASVSPRAAAVITTKGVGEYVGSSWEYYKTHPFAAATTAFLILNPKIPFLSKELTAEEAAAIRGARIEKAVAGVEQLGVRYPLRVYTEAERALYLPRAGASVLTAGRFVPEAEAISRAIAAKELPIRPLPAQFRGTPGGAIMIEGSILEGGPAYIVPRQIKPPPIISPGEGPIINPVTTPESLLRPTPQPILEPIMPVPTRPIPSRPIIELTPPTPIEAFGAGREVLTPTTQLQFYAYDIVRAGREGIPSRITESPSSMIAPLYRLPEELKTTFGESWETTLRQAGTPSIQEYPRMIRTEISKYEVKPPVYSIPEELKFQFGEAWESTIKEAGKPSTEFQDTLRNIKTEVAKYTPKEVTLEEMQPVGRKPIEITEAPGMIYLEPKVPIKYEYGETMPVSQFERALISRDLGIDMTKPYKTRMTKSPMYEDTMREAIISTFEERPVVTEKSVNIGGQIVKQLERTTEKVEVKTPTLVREGRYTYGAAPKGEYAYENLRYPSGETALVLTLSDLEKFRPTGYYSGPRPVQQQYGFAVQKEYGIQVPKQYAILEGRVALKEATAMKEAVAPGQTAYDYAKDYAKTYPAYDYAKDYAKAYATEYTYAAETQPLAAAEKLATETAIIERPPFKPTVPKFPTRQYTATGEPELPPKKPPKKITATMPGYKKRKEKGGVGLLGFGTGKGGYRLVHSDLLSKMRSQAKYGKATELPEEYAPEAAMYEEKFLGGYVPTKEQLEDMVRGKAENSFNRFKANLLKFAPKKRK